MRSPRFSTIMVRSHVTSVAARTLALALLTACAGDSVLAPLPLPSATPPAFAAQVTNTNEWQVWPLSFTTGCTGRFVAGSVRTHLQRQERISKGTLTITEHFVQVPAGAEFVDAQGTSYVFRQHGAFRQLSDHPAGLAGVATVDVDMRLISKGGGPNESLDVTLRIEFDPSGIRVTSAVVLTCRG